MSDAPPDRQCTLPTCEREATDPTDPTPVCETHLAAVSGEEPEDATTSAPSDESIREHYRDARDALNPIATFGNAPTGAFVGNFGWYQTRPITDVDDLGDGWTDYGRVKTLARDYQAIADDARNDSDARSLYALTTYSSAALEPVRCRIGDDGREWEGDANPLPEYGEIDAIAPFADVDLADEYKERPLPEDLPDLVETALEEYRDAFADLMGGPGGVFMLDSVGGAYLFGAPAATHPIAERYDREDRERIFSELMDRLNDWLDDVATDVNSEVPALEGVFEPDYLNNKNRQYKAPLSVHKSIDGVVHPIDVDSPAYEFTPLDDVDDDLRDETREWGERFTDPDHADRVSALVGTLWREYYDREDVATWKDALDAWLEEQRERRIAKAHQRALDERRQRERLAERREALAEQSDKDPADVTVDDALADLEVTSVRKDVFDALEKRAVVDVRDVIRAHCSDEWDTSSRDHETTFDPSWRPSGSGKSCAVPNGGNAFVDNGCDGGGGPAKAYALGNGILPRTETAAAKSLTGRRWGEAIDGLRSDGYDIPVYVPEAGATNGDGEEYDQTPLWALRNAAVALDVCGADDFPERETDDGETFLGFDRETYNATLEALDAEEIDHGREPLDADGGTSLPGPEECAPPVVDADPFDREQHWRELQGERYQEWLDDGRPTRIWGDDAGSGKTTNAVLAAAERDRPHTVLFDKHEKAREFITDDVTPDDYFHLKGGEQPAHDCCMDAVVRAPEGETPTCPIHGDPGEWPRMNPIYERDRDDDLRERYEALVPAVGPRKALIILDEDGELLEDNPWLEQFDGLENRERVVGVHEYQQLKTAVGDRDLILDETPRLLSDTQCVTVGGLTSAALRLEDLADLPSTDEKKSRNLRALAAFAADVRDAIAGDGPADLEDVETPAFDWERYFDVKDPMSGKGTHESLKAETLAQVKLTYNETLVSRIREGDWNGEPFCIDTLLAAAAEAGLDEEATRQAIAVPSTLDSCPWCGGELANDNGARVCVSDGCSWHEAEHTVTRKDADPARAIAWLEDPDGPDRAEHAGIVSTVLPPASDLPDPLVLDATATPSKVAAFYGEDNVDVRGDDPLDLEGKLRATQVLDGQYHAQTIKDTSSLQSRIQSVIDTAGEVHDRPLFGIRGDLIPLFEFPENGEVLKYHAARGLNRAECDAVVLIGAPHPRIDDLERNADLLAMDRGDLRAGGDEHSTRRDAPNPPVYRKLRYQDDDGNGLAVPTKHYTGLVGELFRETRENELVQFVHRIRPLLIDDVEPAKDAYLLTNVPTNLPVDDVVEFDELTGDLSAVFPVAEGAIRLLEYAHDALEGDAPNGFRPGTLVEQREDGTIANKVAGWHRLATMNGEDVTRRTVRNWVDDLEAVGLLSPETYEQRRGVSYAADPATSKKALQVLSGNAGFEVAALRRFSEKVRGSDGSLGWLEWARDALALSGDRCEWGPPPDSAG